MSISIVELRRISVRVMGRGACVHTHHLPAQNAWSVQAYNGRSLIVSIQSKTESEAMASMHSLLTKLATFDEVNALANTEYDRGYLNGVADSKALEGGGSNG